MCAIAGIVDKSTDTAILEHTIVEMLKELHHRGPDDSAYHITDNVVMGANRLAIIDLANGKQPMFNETATVVMVCNGEIYNHDALRQELIARGHKFKTHCDIEVLPHLYEEYGLDFVNKLNGQFAFALYDLIARRLVIGRDHVGICPLFYTFQNGLFAFASEIKALLKIKKVSKEINLTGLDQIFTFPGPVSPATMFRKIQSLQPGHLLLLENDEITVKQYWDLDYPLEADEEIKEDSIYVNGVRERLRKAVSMRMMSDVPVGFYISGGLDSSIIAALGASGLRTADRKSFSISFEDQGIDESYYQQMVVDRLQLSHSKILFQNQNIAELLPTAIFHAEYPLRESYNTCSLMLSECARKNGVKVILTGEGSDELFAGYVGYKFDYQTHLNRENLNDVDAFHERAIRKVLWDDEDFIYDRNYIPNEEIKLSLYSKDLTQAYDEFSCLKTPVIDISKIKGRSKVNRRSYIDFKLRLADHLLSDHGDRVAYANSIEARYPFLDIDLIEFVRTIPSNLKLNNLAEKYILKAAFSEHIPRPILQREKFGFVAPGGQVLLKNHKEWLADNLSHSKIKRQGFFDADAIERLKKHYMTDGFTLNQTFETDMLVIVLTLGILIEKFHLSA